MMMMILRVQTMVKGNSTTCLVSRSNPERFKADLQHGSMTVMEVVEVMMLKKTTKTYVKTP
jgi:hypothetical protein